MSMQQLPSAEQALELAPEELALFVLQYLNDVDNPNSLHLNNFLMEAVMKFKDPKVSEAYSEAWAWLERELMLARKPGTTREVVFITRRGHELLRTGNIQAYSSSNMLRETILDPQLARKVYPTYLRGDYDTAIFQAFKEVEISVRQAGKFGNEKIGNSLMRAAFHPEKGLLTDMNMEAGERQSLSDLFAGAIGVMKNPGSHRDTELDDPQEAAEAILFANYLLRIVDRSTEWGH